MMYKKEHGIVPDSKFSIRRNMAYLIVSSVWPARDLLLKLMELMLRSWCTTS